MGRISKDGGGEELSLSSSLLVVVGAVAVAVLVLVVSAITRSTADVFSRSPNQKDDDASHRLIISSTDSQLFAW